MKRYWAFAGPYYYPGGGMEDFVNDFDSFEEARSAARGSFDWGHVFDSSARSLIQVRNPYDVELRVEHWGRRPAP